LTADHVVDNARTALADWREIDLERLNELADDLERVAREELSTAGVPEARLRFEWMLNLVYPGQTFDNAMHLDRAGGAPITAADVAGCVEEFHRRNEEARLIEARSQEPMVRGVRLSATGLVDQPAPVELAATSEPAAPIARRRMHAGGVWNDNVPVFDGDALRPGPLIEGPAVVQSRFTTLVLRPGDVASVLSNGDTLVEVAGA
jgi:N-methylhydantoinase A